MNCARPDATSASASKSPASTELRGTPQGTRHSSLVPGVGAVGSAGLRRSSPPRSSARVARLRSPLRLIPAGIPVPSSVTKTVRIPSGSVSTVTSTRLASACLAALDSASRSAASTCPASSGPTGEARPAPSRSDGAKPSIGVISSTTATMSLRRSGWPGASRACSAKMVARMSLMVSSIASTALLMRLATSGRVTIGIVPSSDMPVA